MKNESEIKQFVAEESGNLKLPRHNAAPKVLSLKVGCPVIFIHNISACEKT